MSNENTPTNDNNRPASGGPIQRQVRPQVVTETDDWKLGCFMEWRPKSRSDVCPRCHGSKEVGGGFKDIDGPRECPECFGAGIVTKGPRTPKPELPPELREHMRRAWWDFVNAA